MSIVTHNKALHSYEEAAIISDAVKAVIYSGQLINGDQVPLLEDALCAVAKVKHAICVSSGFSALRLATLSLRLPLFSFVAYPDYSCVAIPAAIRAATMFPWPFDIDPLSYNLDGSLVHAVAAVVCVNMFGRPFDIDSVASLGVPVIEDCSHGIGSVDSHGRTIGGRTDVSVISFAATKFVGSDGGGAVLTNRDDVASFVRSCRYYDPLLSVHSQNDLMSEISAAIALIRINSLKRNIAARSLIASCYSAHLQGCIDVPASDCCMLWYRYVVKYPSGAEFLISGLSGHGIAATMPVKPHMVSHIESKIALETAVSLPIYPSLTHDQQMAVIDAVVCIVKSDGGKNA